VLVISGDRDAITLEHTLKIFHALPDAELCVLPGTDHATFSGRSEWLNPIISAFLDRERRAGTPDVVMMLSGHTTVSDLPLSVLRTDEIAAIKRSFNA
jgi:hypothetical protein